MKNLFLITILVFQFAFVNGQSEILINENGILLGYAATRYNSVTIDNVNYDQYEVTIYFKNTKGTYIYAPVLCNVTFHNALEQPKIGSSLPKSSGINFGWLGEYYGGVRTGYQEYKDGTAISLDLDEPLQDKGLKQSRVIKPLHEEKCIKYIFTKQGEPLPSPSHKIDFIDNLIDVNASNTVVEAWMERGYNIISNKKEYRGGLEIPFAFYPNNNNGTPIGNRGDVITEESDNPEETFDAVETRAIFDGDWSKFLSINVNSDILKSLGKPEGVYKAVVKFIVMSDGTIGGIEIVSGDNLVAEELIRVIKLSSGKWIPAQQNGKKVMCPNSQALTMVVSEE